MIAIKGNQTVCKQFINGYCRDCHSMVEFMFVPRLSVYSESGKIILATYKCKCGNKVYPELNKVLED